MKKYLLSFIAMGALLVLPAIASASDKEDDINRTQRAAQVFQEIMNAPDAISPAC